MGCKKIAKQSVKLKIKEIWSTSWVLQWLVKEKSGGIEEFLTCALIPALCIVCFLSLLSVSSFCFWKDEDFNCFFFFFFWYIIFCSMPNDFFFIYINYIVLNIYVSNLPCQQKWNIWDVANFCCTCCTFWYYLY